MQLWTANAGTEIVPDTACALADYSAETGFSAGPPAANDNGTVLLDALQYWMVTGIAIDANGALDRLDGFADIDPADIEGLKRSIEDFGCALLGVELPESAEQQFDAGEPWELIATPMRPLAATPCSLSGTMLAACGWSHGPPAIPHLGLVGQYGSEAYALLRREWIGRAGISPSNLTMAELDEVILRMRGTLGLGAAA